MVEVYFFETQAQTRKRRDGESIYKGSHRECLSFIKGAVRFSNFTEDNFRIFF